MNTTKVFRKRFVGKNGGLGMSKKRFNEIEAFLDEVQRDEKSLWLLAIVHLDKASRQTVIATYDELVVMSNPH